MNLRYQYRFTMDLYIRRQTYKASNKTKNQTSKLLFSKVCYSTTEIFLKSRTCLGVLCGPRTFLCYCISQ
jgi:hypothetical protein